MDLVVLFVRIDMKARPHARTVSLDDQRKQVQGIFKNMRPCNHVLEVIRDYFSLILVKIFILP